MATLVIVTHEFDQFAYRRVNPTGGVTSPYLLFDVLKEFETLGHGWRVSRGSKVVPGDVALLHVDCTVIDQEYLSLGPHYRATINFGTNDNSKRKISCLLLGKDDDWAGPVVVKTNLNCQGIPEDLHNRRALNSGRPLPHPGARRSGPYRVFERLEDVGNQVWTNPALVVERFVPEVEAREGYALRTWVFMGQRERCTRSLTRGCISKASDVIRYEPIDVPPQLRAERERLNFDFGKFDFVMHNGTPILLDANRTPGVALPLRSMMKAGARNLAEGLDELVRRAV